MLYFLSKMILFYFRNYWIVERNKRHLKNINQIQKIIKKESESDSDCCFNTAFRFRFRVHPYYFVFVLVSFFQIVHNWIYLRISIQFSQILFIFLCNSYLILIFYINCIVFYFLSLFISLQFAFALTANLQSFPKRMLTDRW